MDSYNVLNYIGTDTGVLIISVFLYISTLSFFFLGISLGKAIPSLAWMGRIIPITTLDWLHSASLDWLQHSPWIGYNIQYSYNVLHLVGNCTLHLIGKQHTMYCYRISYIELVAKCYIRLVTTHTLL